MLLTPLALVEEAFEGEGGGDLLFLDEVFDVDCGDMSPSDCFSSYIEVDDDNKRWRDEPGCAAAAHFVVVSGRVFVCVLYRTNRDVLGEKRGQVTGQDVVGRRKERGMAEAKFMVGKRAIPDMRMRRKDMHPSKLYH